MQIYSQKILQFISTIKQEIRQILDRETPCTAQRERFSLGRFSYPVRVVIFNHKEMLGYFDPNFFELGFHSRLMHASKEQLGRIIRHELAHYLTFIEYKSATILSHGPEFLSTCQKLNWGPEISAASVCLENETSHEEDSTILRKVQKLMALSTSSNSHEAEQAMIKSQQLLLKHNLCPPDPEEPIVLKRILERKKADSLLHAITKILETFFVNCVFSKGTESLCLEIAGRKENVEIAEYVARCLEEKLPSLWEEARRSHQLKGTVAKNSFLMGLALGYCDKVKALEQNYSEAASQALLKIENVLADAKAMIYPRLSQAKSSRRQCQNASDVGQKMGRSLSINPALKGSSQSNTPSLLR